jgi:flagellar hook-associated protein 1 FlgK
MSIPALTGIETALSGLEADQAELDTTGNNIDNASTPGYSEEVVNLSPSLPQPIPADSEAGGFTQVGTGVDIDSITRVRNQFLDVQYRAQNTQLGSATATATQLGNAQSMLGESGGTTGLATELSQFWSDWNSVADDPTSKSAQQALVDDGQTLTQGIQSLNSQLAGVQTQAQTQYNELTGPNGQLLDDANKINSLNQTIAASLEAGQSPNELEDERDSALDDLSSLGQVSTSTASNGQITVNFGDAKTPLVAAGTGSGLGTVTAPTGLSGSNAITAAGTGGQLGALLTLASASGPIAGYQTSLSGVASALISSVNSLSTTTPFFSGTNASTIAVAVTAGNVQTATAGNPGGNDVASAVAALQGGSADQGYASLIAKIGSDVQSAQSNQSNTQAIVTATQNQRESVSGVSLDQEMTSLISEQRGYQASAQTLNTLDNVLNTFLSQMQSAGV